MNSDDFIEKCLLKKTHSGSKLSRPIAVERTLAETKTVVIAESITSMSDKANFVAKPSSVWDDAAIALIGRDISHGYGHAKRVRFNVDHLLPDLDPKNDALQFGLCAEAHNDARVLALLHDVNDHKYQNADAAGTLDALLQKHLTFLSVPEAKEIIACATWSGRHKEQPLGDTARLLIALLSCADRLDAMGSGGIERCELFVRLHLMKADPDRTNPENRNGFEKRVARAVIVHAYEKLVHLRAATIWTGPIGRDLSDKAHQELLTSLSAYEDKHRMTVISQVSSVFSRHIQPSSFKLVGLNIEGGLPAQKLGKTNFCDRCKWVNLVLVLDHPLAGNHSFEEVLNLQRENSYPILESMFLEINENKQLALYLLLVRYYANLCQNVGVHIHQFPNNARFFVDFLKAHSGVDNVTYFYDTPTWTHTNCDYTNLDCLISLGQCAGIDTQISVGTFLAPTMFVPFQPESPDIISGDGFIDLSCSSGLSKAYVARNDLVSDWSKIVSSAWNNAEDLKEAALHKSANPAKNDTNGDRCRVSASRFPAKPSDIMFGDLALLQTTDIWNPVSALDVVHF